MQQTACLVVKPITVGNFALLFNCTPVGLTSDSMTVPTIDERVVAGSCVCCQAHRGLTVGFLLLRYSVVCTYESLSLFLSAFHTPVLKKRSYHGMALSVRPDVLANRHLLSTFPKCLFPKLNRMFVPFKIEGDLLGTSCFAG